MYHLTDEQVELLVTELDRIIDGDRYPLSQRIRALRRIRERAAQVSHESKQKIMTSSPRYFLQIASKGKWETVMYLNDLEEAWRTIAKVPEARVFDTWSQEPLTRTTTAFS